MEEHLKTSQLERLGDRSVGHFLFHPLPERWEHELCGLMDGGSVTGEMDGNQTQGVGLIRRHAQTATISSGLTGHRFS